MQVQEEVGKHHDDAVASIDRRRVPDDALPNLRFADDFAECSHASGSIRNETGTLMTANLR